MGVPSAGWCPPSAATARRSIEKNACPFTVSARPRPRPPTSLIVFFLLEQTHTHAGDEEVPAGGIVTGLGRIHGRLVAIAANDATVKGGT